MPDERPEDVKNIRLAYLRADKALGDVGHLLRTTQAGRFGWAAGHKTAVSGLKAIVMNLYKTVPHYLDPGEE